MKPFNNQYFVFASLILWAFLSVLPVANAAGVMGIDFGTDWFKVAVIKPGVPLETVLNKDSQRKTDAVIAIRDGVRYFGSDAVTAGLRYPQDLYGKLKDLLGRPFEDPVAADYRQQHDNDMLRDEERGSCSFSSQDGAVYTVEELVANILAHAKQQCEAFVGEPVRDAVITVPPFWTHRERQSLLDAAESAGLRVLSLINDETAVALNYAMTRQFDPKPQYHMFFDMGAGSTVAALVSFRSQPEKPVAKTTRFTKNTTLIQVHSIGYDAKLGGYEIDVRLQQHLAAEFDKTIGKKRKIDIYKSRRAMTRLLREANRIKHILSANTETTASVESLIDDVDFRCPVSRVLLEEMSKDLFDRVAGPINSALEKGGLTMNDIQSFVLVGGGMRVPAIQQKLQEIVGGEKIAKHVNADEAAVLGAAYRAADISPQFRVRSFKINDIVLHPVSLLYSPASSAGDDGEITRQTVFAADAFLGSKRKVTFKKQKDFTVNVSQPMGSTEESATAFSIKVAGVQEAISKHSTDLVEGAGPKVKLYVTLTTSGTIQFERAAVDLETKAPSTGESLKDKVFSFFGGGSGSDSPTSEEDQPADKADSSAEGETTSEKPEEGSTKSEEDIAKDQPAKEEKNEKSATEEEAASEANSTSSQQQQIPLVIDVQAASDGFRSLSSLLKTEISERMKRMDAEDEQKRQRDEARNSLEAFVYSSLDALDSADILRVSTEPERTALSKALSSASEWLSDEGDSPDIPTTEFKTRLADLKKLRNPLDFRVSESTKRQPAVEKLSAVLAESKKYIFEQFTNLSADARLLTETDTQRLSELIEKSDKWLGEKVAEQSKLPATADPVLKSADLLQRTLELERELMVVKNKRRQLAAAAKAAAEAALKSAAAAAASSASAASSTATDSSSESATATTSAAETTEEASPKPLTPERPVQPTANPYHEEL